MEKLKGKTILITGSSRGMGAAAARLAAAYGATPILHGKSESAELKKLAEELDAKYITCDVANKKDVITAVEKLLLEVGQIHALINSAGIVKPKPFLELEDEDWQDEFSVNTLGTVHFCQALIPYMKEKKYGRIVNVASIRGHSSMASGRGSSYSVSKAAIVNLTAALAKEFSPEIAVNAVSPGFTETDMSKTWNDVVWSQARSALLERPGKPEELAETMLFLSSDHSSFTTGQTLIVDGGYELSGK